MKKIATKELCRHLGGTTYNIWFQLLDTMIAGPGNMSSISSISRDELRCRLGENSCTRRQVIRCLQKLRVCGLVEMHKGRGMKRIVHGTMRDNYCHVPEKTWQWIDAKKPPGRPRTKNLETTDPSKKSNNEPKRAPRLSGGAPQMTNDTIKHLMSAAGITKDEVTTSSLTTDEKKCKDPSERKKPPVERKGPPFSLDGEVPPRLRDVRAKGANMTGKATKDEVTTSSLTTNEKKCKDFFDRKKRGSISRETQTVRKKGGSISREIRVHARTSYSPYIITEGLEVVPKKGTIFERVPMKKRGSFSTSTECDENKGGSFIKESLKANKKQELVELFPPNDQKNQGELHPSSRGENDERGLFCKDKILSRDVTFLNVLTRDEMFLRNKDKLDFDVCNIESRLEQTFCKFKDGLIFNSFGIKIPHELKINASRKSDDFLRGLFPPGGKPPGPPEKKSSELMELEREMNDIRIIMQYLIKPEYGGGAADMYFCEPSPLDAKTDWSEEKILRHVGQLWCDIHEHVYGTKDHRLRRTKRYKQLILDWWKVCADVRVKPAEYIYWAVTSWKEYHGASKKTQIAGVFSIPRVKHPARRQVFRQHGKELGGMMRYPRENIIMHHKISGMDKFLGMFQRELQEDFSVDVVRRIVNVFFPEGLAAVHKRMAEIRQDCARRRNELIILREKGHFIWDGRAKIQDY